MIVTCPYCKGEFDNPVTAVTIKEHGTLRVRAENAEPIHAWMTLRCPKCSKQVQVECSIRRG